MDYAVWEQYDVWPQFVEDVCADGGFANRAAAKEFCESVRARHQMVKYLRSRGVDLSKIPPPKYPRLASGDELRDIGTGRGSSIAARVAGTSTAPG